MASLLSSVTATTSTSAAAHHRSSPEPPSSEPAEPSSDSSFFSSRKRYTDEHSPYPRKSRVSEVTVKRELDVENVPYPDVDMDEAVVKAEPIDEDDDEEMRVTAKPLVTGHRANGANGASRRRVVNSSSVKVVKADLVPPRSEPTPKSPSPNGKIVPGAQHWSAVQEALIAPKTSELDEVKAHIGNVKPENVLEGNGDLHMYWLDFMEEGGVVHLIGKVMDRASSKWVSACVSISGIQRNLFVKPRRTRFGGS